MATDLQFKPDYAVPPGQTLLETIERLQMSQTELARRTSRPVKTINEIIQGKTAIMPETAIQLERVLGVPARLWNSLERNYREALARIEEQKRLESEIPWLKRVPVRELIQMDVLPDLQDKVALLAAALNFFGVATTKAWETQWAQPQAAFRRSRAFVSSAGALAAWLRLGELQAQRIDCRDFNAARFRSTLGRIRGLTREDPSVYQAEIVRLCSEAGVAVVFVPELPKTRVSGATRWLSSERALLQLSLRYKTDDQLWFSFFHEAGHILLHGKREVFVEGPSKTDSTQRDQKEREADRFAGEALIPSDAYKAFVLKGRYNAKGEIERFAAEMGIAAGIVLGRLQHEGYVPPHSEWNDLKVRLTLARTDLRETSAA